jgi:DNA polymerase IV
MDHPHARRILHIDMDAFFAAVEEQRNPALTGKPVIIGGTGDPSQRGVVSTANYAARKYGIHSALPLRTAYKLCPQAVFLPVDYEAYVLASRKFKAVLKSVSPIMQDVGIDEAYLDITALPETDTALADRIKAGISAATGLTCSIGIAPNKLLAKIASDLQKPDGLTIITAEDRESKLWPLPIRKLYGVGPKTEAYLQNLAVATIGELAALPLTTLIESFGNSYGQYLYDASRGIDDSPLITHWEPKSISRETTFQTDVKDWQTIARTMAELTKDVLADMKQQRYKTRTITIKIRFSDFQTLTRTKTMSVCTDSEESMRKSAFACLKLVELKKKVRLIGVRASNLERLT